eukprot:Gb_09511 [translate_table: standard]
MALRVSLYGARGLVGIYMKPSRGSSWPTVGVSSPNLSSPILNPIMSHPLLHWSLGKEVDSHNGVKNPSENGEKGGLPMNIPLVKDVIIEDNDFPRVGRDVTAQETLVLIPGQMEVKCYSPCLGHIVVEYPNGSLLWAWSRASTLITPVETFDVAAMLADVDLGTLLATGVWTHDDGAEGEPLWCPRFG